MSGFLEARKASGSNIARRFIAMKTVYAAIAGATFLLASAPQAEAARCPQGSIYRPSKAVCVSKASAIRAGVYKPRKVQRVRAVKRATPRQTRAVRSIAISPSRQLKIDLLAWVQRNRAWIVEAGL